jgi:hypothetical protein
MMDGLFVGLSITLVLRVKKDTVWDIHPATEIPITKELILIDGFGVGSVGSGKVKNLFW